MIDYVKLYLENIDIQRLLYHTELDFKSELSKTTGEVKENILVANYHFCKVTIKNSNPENAHVLFTGSIHKMWNSLNGIKAPNFSESKGYRGFNGNSFTLADVIAVRKHLEILFDCNASQMIFQNIELGVNVSLPFLPHLYLKGLLYHKSKSFEFSHSENNAQAVHQFFIFKIYNKSYQYHMAGNVLRAEVKIIKMAELTGSGIKAFSDIHINTLLNAQTLLLKRFDEVMHYDYTIQKKRLSNRQLEAIKNYSNPRFWIYDLKPIHRDRHKKKLKEITADFSQRLHQQIRNTILEKCVMINQLPKTPNCVMVNHSDIGLEATHN